MSYAEIGQLVTGATGVLLLGFAGYGIANLRFKVPGSPFFVALTLAGAIWCFGYAFEKAQTLASGFILASRIEYLGLAFLPPLWFLVALNWMEHPWARSRGFRLAVLSVGAVALALVWTNESHHLWYESVVPTGIPGFAHFQPGVAYYWFAALFMASFFLSSALLITRRGKVPLFRQKATVILTANLFPILFETAYQLGFRPGGLDPAIFALVPSFSTLAWGLFRHDFIRIVPIAWEAVVESLDQAVLVFDPHGRLVDHNRTAEPMLEGFTSSLRALEGPRGELTLPGPEGTKTFRFRRSPIQNPSGQSQGSVVLITDTTDEKRLLDELAHAATHDALTGMANRRHFEDHAMGEITRASRLGGTLALVLFDLDGFKSVNDRYGHPAGDQVLKSVATILGPRLRPYDLLARVGGEEFAVLMPEANPVEAREAAERWRAALEVTTQVLPGAVFTMTASFGVATLNDLPITTPLESRIRLDALLGLADRALYRAKAEGRNRVC